MVSIRNVTMTPNPVKTGGTVLITVTAVDVNWEQIKLDFTNWNVIKNNVPSWNELKNRK